VPGYQLGATNVASTDARTNNAGNDGVSFLTPLRPGQGASLQVVASGAGYLNGWIDYGTNGSWAALLDQTFTNAALVPGTNTLSFTVPAGALVTPATWARFRFSSTTNLSFSGEAPDGEVEDYQLAILSNLPPVIELSAPANGAAYTAPATIDLLASVTTNGNTINKVRFYDNGTNLITEVSVPPYSYSWTGVSAGSYSLLARVLYNGSSSTDSAAIGVIVTNPPTVTPPFITSVSEQSDGSFTLTGTGMVGQTYVLLTASNLVPPIDWASSATNTADTNGVFSFSDPQTTDSPQRFYRVLAR